MKKVLALMALMGLALTGCGSHQVAARVEGTTITSDRVEALTQVDCALAGQAGQAASSEPLRLRRAATLSRLIDFEVLRRVAKEERAGYDRLAYVAQLGQMRTDLAALPEAKREVAEEFFSAYIKSVLQLAGLASARLQQQGVTAPQQEQVQGAMQDIYAQAREGLDIEVNPVFAPDEQGVPGAQDGSLSTAVSDYSKEAASPEPGPDYVAGLSKNQLCG